MITAAQLVELRQRAKDIQARIDCQHLAEQELGEGKHSGETVAYHSPFRADDDTPSFMAYPGNRGFTDFGDAHQTYDCIAFVRKLHNLSFTEALDYLDGGIITPLRLVPPIVSPLQRAHQPDPQFQARAAHAVQAGEATLWRNYQVATYLYNRGVKPATARAFHLGYDPQRGILIPWYQDGHLVSVRYRRHVGNFAAALGVLPVEGGKYDCLKGSKPSLALFNGDAIRPDRPVVIVEGEFDAMLGQQIASDLAVFVTRGSASAGKLPPTIKDQLTTATQCLIVLDNDGAGSAGTQALAQQLPDATAHQLPSGKDLTDFVLAGGDLRAWLTDILSAVYLHEVSDGIREAAWNCKLDAALLAYELASWAHLDHFTKPDLIAIGEKFGVPESTIRRGVDQGVGVFLAQATAGEDSSADFGRKAAAGGRPPERYQVLNQAAIVNQLADRLPRHLIRKHFTLKGRLAIIPEPTRQLLEHAKISETDSQRVIYEIKVAYGRQNAAEAQRHYTAYRRDLAALLKALHIAHGTPIKWVQDCPHEALYLHAVQLSEPADRSCAEYARMIGKRSNNVGRIVKLAGIKSSRRAPTYIPLTQPEQVIIDACTAAKGQGAIIKLVAQQDGQPAAEHPFDRATAQPWANQQVAQGRAIGMLLAVPNKQEIVSEPLPVVRVVRLVVPPPAETPMTAPEPDRLSLTRTAPSAAKPVKAPHPAPVTDDPWLRDYLLRAYCLNHGVDFEALPRESITITDAVNLLLDRVERGAAEDDTSYEEAS